MNDEDTKGSGSTTAIVIVFLLLGLRCLASMGYCAGMPQPDDHRRRFALSQ
jgi:hypothetical protein